MARRNERGFTLVEVMVSSLIMTIVVATLAMVFSTIIKIWVTGLAEAEMIQNARGALMRISEDMQAVVPPYKESLSEFVGLSDAGSRVGTNSVADELHYYVNTYNSVEEQSTPNRSGDISKRWIWLTKAGSEDSRLQYLVSNGSIPNASPYGLDADSQPDGLPMSSTGNNSPFAYYVANFNVQYTAWYTDTTTTVWRDVWDSRSSGSLTAGDATDDNRLPDMVRITLQMVDPKNTVPPRSYTLTIRPGAHHDMESFLAPTL